MKKESGRNIKEGEKVKNKVFSAMNIELPGYKYYLVAFFIFLFSFSLSLRWVCPTIFPGDGGELIAAAHTLGICHPPGYPLYMHLVKISTILLPFGNIAYRANILSGFAASITIALTFLVSVAFKIPLPFSIFGALMLITCNNFLNQSIIAEVYSLHILFLLFFILILVKWNLTKSLKLIYLLSFVIGLSISHHLSTFFLLPAIIIFLFITPSGKRLNTKDFAILLILFLLGISFYLYIPIRSRKVDFIDWSHPDRLSAFIFHISGRAFQDKALEGGVIGAFSAIKLLLKTVAVDLVYLGAITGIIGFLFFYRFFRQFFWLFVLIFLGNLILVLIYRIVDIQAYFLPFMVILCLSSGAGLAFLWHRIKTKFTTNLQRVIFSFILIILPIMAMIHSCYYSDRSGHYTAFDFGMNILKTVEYGGTIFTMGDNEVFPLAYLLAVEKVRPDVKIFHRTGFLFSDLYGYSSTLKVNKKSVRAVKEKEYLERASGPVYYVDPLEYGEITDWETIPEGLIFKAHPMNKIYRKKKDYWDLYVQRGLEEWGFYKEEYLTSYILTKFQMRKAQYMAKIGAQEDAELLYQGMSETGKNIGKAQYNIGLMFEEKKQFADAADAYRRAINLEPDLLPAYLRLGIVLEEMGDIRQAMENYRYVVKKEPNNFEANLRLGHIYELQGNFRDAINYYSIAAKIKPDSADVHNNLGVCYGSMGNLDAAVKELKIAISLDPQSSKAHNNLGVIYNNLGQFDLAIEELKKTIALDPKYAEAYANLALSYLLQDHIDPAVAAYEKALSLNPNLSRAQYNLGYIYLYKKGDKERGIEHWKRFLELEPDSPQAATVRSELYNMTGKKF